MERMIQLLKQYRYGVLVLLIGIGLMMIPSETDSDIATESVSQMESYGLREELEQILSQVDGAGKVRVLLTESAGEIRLYQQDINNSGENRRQETVVVSGSDRSESGLIRQILPAAYQGAVVVCQGGDRASVRLAIVEAISSATGLTSDKITVLKMK